MRVKGRARVQEVVRVARRQAFCRWVLVRELEGDEGSPSFVNILNVVKGVIQAALFALLGLLERVPDVPIGFVKHWGKLGDVHVAIHVDVVRPSGGA